MSRRIVTRQDGTRRVVELSRSGRVKADWPACDSCEGTGVDDGDRITHARITLARWAENCAANGNARDASLYRDALRLVDGTDDAYIEGLRAARGAGECGACQALRAADLDSFLSGGLAALPLPSRCCPNHGGSDWPEHDWDYAARGAMSCRRCGMIWSDTCPTECDGVMPY